VRRVEFQGLFFVVAGVWLSTIGGCGRTLPLTDDEYYDGVGASGDDDANGGSAARGGSGARGGSTSTGGSTSKGGSQNRGGTSNGGTTPGTGGATGGSSSGGVAGDLPTFGGSTFTGGTGFIGGGTGGDLTQGGTGNTGGTIVVTGGTSNAGRGGAVNGGAGGMGAFAGTGAQGGQPPMTGVRCGDQVCDAGTVCCARRGNPSFCMNAGDTCRGAQLECSGPGACAEGEVCCFNSFSSACSATCDVTVGMPGTPPTIILCDSSDDCATDQTCVVAPRGIPYCADVL
jgi:hypothetical protein